MKKWMKICAEFITEYALIQWNKFQMHISELNYKNGKQIKYKIIKEDLARDSLFVGFIVRVISFGSAYLSVKPPTSHSVWNE